MTATILKAYPALYTRTKKGSVQVWMQEVINDEGVAKIRAVYGQLGGKMQTSYRPVLKGKNIGRRNETTPEEQAILEADYRYQKKLDKGATLDENPETPFRPMLAKSFSDRADSITFPVVVQPKLNGVRCIATRTSDSTIKYTSRLGKEFTTLNHLTAGLIRCLDVGETFDGEIYLHGASLQSIQSLLKKFNDGTDPNNEVVDSDGNEIITVDLEYWVYDIVDTDLNTFDRMDKVFQKIDFIMAGLGIVRVPFYQVPNTESVMYTYESQLRSGSEGAVVRMDGPYELNTRSDYLLKLKDFRDSEYLITNVTCDVDECIIFVCSVDGSPDRLFHVVPAWPKERRRYEYLNNSDKFPGKELTVRYSDISTNGIPIGNPVGVAVRDCE